MLSTELDRTGLRRVPQRVTATERRVVELEAPPDDRARRRRRPVDQPEDGGGQPGPAPTASSRSTRVPSLERGPKKWVDSLTNVGKPRILVGPPRSYDRLMSCDVKPGWATVGSANA